MLAILPRLEAGLRRASRVIPGSRTQLRCVWLAVAAVQWFLRGQFADGSLEYPWVFLGNCHRRQLSYDSVVQK